MITAIYFSWFFIYKNNSLAKIRCLLKLFTNQKLQSYLWLKQILNVLTIVYSQLGEHSTKHKNKTCGSQQNASTHDSSIGTASIICL